MSAYPFPIPGPSICPPVADLCLPTTLCLSILSLNKALYLSCDSRLSVHLGSAKRRFSRMESALQQLMAATAQRQQDLVQLPKAVPPVFFLSVPTAPVGFGGPEPIQLVRTPLTSEEKDKRLTLNLCLYCGQRGHFVYRCPAKAQSPQVSRNMLVSSTTVPCFP